MTYILFRNFRFVAGPDNYEASTGNGANSCFCSGINSESALCGKKDGLFDVSECQYGAPVLVSWPHFYQVQNVYKRNKRNTYSINASIKIRMNFKQLLFLGRLVSIKRCCRFKSRRRKTLFILRYQQGML